jgi:hypothetical protein
MCRGFLQEGLVAVGKIDRGVFGGFLSDVRRKTAISLNVVGMPTKIRTGTSDEWKPEALQGEISCQTSGHSACLCACVHCDGYRGQRGVARPVTCEAPQIMHVYSRSTFLQYLVSAIHSVGVELQPFAA